MSLKMRIQTHQVVIFIVVLCLLRNCNAGQQYDDNNITSINRKSFPDKFIFGTASSAYQYEGAAKEGGRGPSIWDTFTRLNGGGKIDDKSNGDVAADSYHRYKEDIALMKDLGFDAHRFSISWSRILPKGTISGGVNKEGIKYYNNFINELLANGIQPFVTLFHWDLPQALQDAYGGLLSPKFVNDFSDFADLCFKEFGDRVKHWITINEPWSVSVNGFTLGAHAPGRCSDRKMCAEGNSGTEPYIASHYQLLAHAAAAQLYKHKYQAIQGGKIGISLLTFWFEPLTNSTEDIEATKRARDFMFGWFFEPLTKGDYPEVMRKLVGERLPKFSPQESAMVQSSYDFIGVNYYTSHYIISTPKIPVENYFLDSQTITSNTSIGPKVGKWISVYPIGLEKVLLYIRENYNNPLIYITENGVDESGDLPMEVVLADNSRIDYFTKHLYHLNKAIKNGVNVGGYFAWSLLDNFEWGFGYMDRYGIFYVDFKNGLKRTPKASAHWFKKFLTKDNHTIFPNGIGLGFQV